MALKVLDDAEITLRTRLGGDIYDRSDFHRRRLDRSGLGRHGVRHISDLLRLPPMTLEDVKSPSSLLLVAEKERPLANRRYGPLEWIRTGNVVLAYSDEDLVALGELGGRLLTAAGITASDVIVNLLPNGPTREHLQLSAGAQHVGASTIDLGPGQAVDQINVIDPTVLMGEPTEVVRVLDELTIDDGNVGRIHTALVTGTDLTPRQYKRIVELLGGNKSAVVRAWAPDGVLALWGQCRGGAAFHSWAGLEVLEVVDPISGLAAPEGMPGRLIWTGVGWYSSALVRLDTGAAVVLHNDTCPTCGRRSTRIEPVEYAGGFVEALDASDLVKSWAAELQNRGDHNELVIWIHPPDGVEMLRLVTELNLRIGEVQLHVATEQEIEQRIVDANGERFSDHRSF